jgi:2-dehydro-3-deoxy-D-arabinonate dehydratase
MLYCRFFAELVGSRFGVYTGTEIVDLQHINEQWTDFLALYNHAKELDMPLDEVVRDALLATESPLKAPWGSVQNPPGSDYPCLLPPIEPPESWGAGVTYRQSAMERDADARSLGGIYHLVYFADRPELFFKATPARTVGPRDFAGIRPDSLLTMPEPELAVILDSDGTVLGYTIADDVSAWDIERENPLFLPQSKIFPGCLVIGPFLATPEEIPDPLNLGVKMTITRHDELIFSGESNTNQMRKKIPELVSALLPSGPIPPGTLLSTGTGIMVPNEHCLRPGDEVSITIENIGTLIHGVKAL